MREIVTNDGDATPWQVDTTRQLVSIANEGQSRALYATADVRTLPIITIAEHERHVIDLYFPLPSTVSGDRALPRFDVLWSVDTAQRTVSSRTTFDRVEVDQYAYAPNEVYGSPYYYGWGPYTWYDPLWPSGVVFVHSPHVRFGDHGHVEVGHYGGGYHAHAGGGGHVAGGGHHR